MTVNYPINQMINVLMLTLESTWNFINEIKYTYSKNSLHDIDVTWQPRRVDWNVHA